MAAERILASSGPTRASVIVLHGYSASGAVHLEEARAFASEHTEVVLPDAPGHGQREDGRLARLAELPDEPRRSGIYEIARKWAGELPALVDRSRARGAERTGIVGISMGGYAAFASLAAPCPFACVVTLLAAPTLLDPATVGPERPPLMIGLAGRDQAVPPGPGRAFAADYGAQLHEYPESEHMMRGEDWHDLWGKAASFLRRHLHAFDG